MFYLNSKIYLLIKIRKIHILILIFSFSGADMSILVRDASYEPLRKCERATKYKKVIGPTGKE